MSVMLRRYLTAVIFLSAFLHRSVAFSQCDTPAGTWWGSDFGELEIDHLPNTRRISSLLENQDPFTVTEPFDTGGLQTGAQPIFGTLGSSWTENRYFLAGTDVTDPYWGGRALLDPDLDSLAKIHTVTAAKPAMFAGAGSTVCSSLHPPPDSFTAASRFDFSQDALQAGNTPQVAPLVAGSNLLHWLDGSARAGGRIQGSIPLFVSASIQHLAKDGDANGHAASISGRQVTVTAQAWISRWRLTYAGGQLLHSGVDPDYTALPGANAQEDNVTHLFSGDGSWSLRSSSLSLHAAFLHSDLTSASQALEIAQSSPPGLLLPRIYTSDSPPPLLIHGPRSRLQLDLRDLLRLGARHNAQFGLHWDRSSFQNHFEAPPAQSLFVQDVPREVLFWNSTTSSPSHIQNFSLFAQDDWRPASRLLFPIGLRWDFVRGNHEAETISWSTVEPRVQAILMLSQKIHLSAGYARYGRLMKGQYLDFGNQEAPGGEVHEWTDANHNGAFEQNEAGPLLSRFGGSVSAIDAKLQRPTTDEITVGYEDSLPHGVSFALRLFHRSDHHLIAVNNTGVPDSAYHPVSLTDPGNDGIPGTSDDAVFTVYSVDPSFLGRDFLVLTNRAFGDGTSRGFQLQLRYEAKDRFVVNASFTGTQTDVPTAPGNSPFRNDPGTVGTLGADPNTVLLARSTSYFDRGFVGKLAIDYNVTHGWNVGVTARYFDGLPFGRLLLVDGLPQGPFYIRVTPRDNFPEGFRTQFNPTLDFRVEKTFHSSRHSWTVAVEGFNVLNQAHNTQELDLTSVNFSERVPVSIQSPRLLLFELAWSFNAAGIK